MQALNAHRPHKYRPNAAPANEVAKELMNVMRRLRAEERQQQRALEDGSVEGEVVD